MATLLQRAMDKNELLSCEGYQSAFIKSSVNLSLQSVLPAEKKMKLPIVEGNSDGFLNYSGLTVLYNRERKLPFVSAYNIDGGMKATNIRRTEFRKDERLADAEQLDFKFYNLRKDITEFEIGHMAANNEMAWGSEAQLQSYRTFHFPNSVPQAERLNSGLWRSLEKYILDESASVSKNKKISVFTGPILTDRDPRYVMDRSFRLPLLFYKVVVFEGPDGLYSTAFVMSHEKKLYQDNLLVKERRAVPVQSFMDFDYKKVFQISVQTVEKLSGLKFNWKGVKKIKIPGDKNLVKLVRTVGDLDDVKVIKKGIVKGKGILKPKLKSNIILF